MLNFSLADHALGDTEVRATQNDQTKEHAVMCGPGRVGAQSGLGPGPGWGPYGPLCVQKIRLCLKIINFDEKS